MSAETKKYQCILLDWDGNLAKTLDIWLEAVRVPMQKRGLNLSDTEIASSFGQPVEYFEKWGVTDVWDAIHEMDALAAKLMPEVELYPDALTVLETLKNDGKQLALITSSLRRNVAHVLEKYNILQHFDVVITSEDTEHHKPHPEPLEKALALLGSTKDEAIMIGDSDKDMGVALNAKVDSILFYPPAHQKFYDLEKLKALRPTYIVSDFRKVLEIV